MPAVPGLQNSGTYLALQASSASQPATSSLPTPEDMTSMTPDALMAYCSSQLNGLDSQMDTIFNQQQEGQAEINMIAPIATALQAYESGGIQNNQQECLKLAGQIYTVYENVSNMSPPNPGLANGVATIYNQVLASGSGPMTDPSSGQSYDYIGSKPSSGHTEQDNTLDSDEIAGYVSEAQNLTNGINSNMELQMISLQSMMSQRQEAVELTTNLVQGLDDTTEKVVENVRAAE